MGYNQAGDGSGDPMSLMKYDMNYSYARYAQYDTDGEWFHTYTESYKHLICCPDTLAHRIPHTLERSV